MKYKSIAAIFLLVLPLFIIPLTTANTMVNVEFRIRPGANKFYGPCLVSTEFPVDVYLWNMKTYTGVGVYAYDFFVYWKNDQGFSLVEDGFVNHIPWATGKFYLVKNETDTFAGDTTYDFYHLAVTALGNSTLNPSLELGAIGEFNASLVTLTFHIDEEPFYPGSFHSDFLIGNELGADGFAGLNPVYWPHVSTGCTVPITNLEIENGTYDLIVERPTIDPEASLAAPYAKNITVGAVGVTETVYIHLKNVTGVYGFGFQLWFDPAWKQTDVQHITILPAFAPPYEDLFMFVNNDTGYIDFSLRKPSEKPTVCSKDIAVVKIDFVSTLTPEVGAIPYNYTTGYFAILNAYIRVKSETQQSFDYNYPGELAYSGNLGNFFIKKSLADLNLDGIVDILDLGKVAKKYGLASNYDELVDTPPTGADSSVDIFDIVFVAKRFGDPEW